MKNETVNRGGMYP